MAHIVGDLNLHGGQLIDVRAESVPNLPSFSSGNDEGRIVYVDSGPDIGFWFGSIFGGATFTRLTIGGVVATYTLTDQAINNGVTFSGTMTADTTAAKTADVVKVALSSDDITSGQVRVILYEDIGRASEFYNAVFDMADPQIDRIPAFFDVDNGDGDIYVDIINNTGSNGTFTLVLLTGGRILMNTNPAPGDGTGINAGVAGDGIVYNALDVRLDIELSPDSGLRLVGASGARKLEIFPTPNGGISTSVSGAEVDATVLRTNAVATVDELISFQDSLSILPAATPGAPTSGTHAVGELYRDSNQDLWQCVAGGTPGGWVFFGFKEESFGGETDGSSYTGTITAGSSVVLELAMTGRRGWIRKLNLWGSNVAFASGDVDVSMRVVAYPNENIEGREQLWMFSWQLRKTYATAIANVGASSIAVFDIGLANNDDLIRVRKLAGTDAEEYQRVTARDTLNNEIDVDETLINALAADDPVMFVTELINAPVRNNSVNPGDLHTIFLEIFNDDDTTSVIVGYDLLFEDQGGGIPI